MTLRYAYNTNGAANHRLDDALRLIADAGYDGVALTLDHVLVDRAVGVDAVSGHDVAGSDHRSLVAVLRLPAG